MHLSNEIQRRLTKLNSSVKLASTVYGDFPEKYAFHEGTTRSFRVEFASNFSTLSVVLFERTEQLKYEYCFARGLFTDTDRLATLIDFWVDKEKEVKEIKQHFDEIELFADFDFRNPNNDIDKAWTKIKNIFFNDTKFWEHAEWRIKYLEMLTVAKGHKNFENYYPFTSHYWLRFSPTKTITTANLMDYYILACFDTSKGEYCVSLACELKDAIYFKTANECLDFAYETYYKEKFKQY
jgi:hypothetical protein